ncbi:MAG TPA: SDR family oxidoreductase [Frankiaceae bacterium]|nr:SDR family oxidoreductase [Frankiaceae bacterium]
MRVFVTGASGWIGSAVVPELIAAGHEVTGLARSDASAAALTAAGAAVQRGNLDDVESLRAGARASDAVIHLAYIHDFSQFDENARIDLQAIQAIGAELEGSDKPFVITGGTAALTPGQVSTERDTVAPDHPLRARAVSEEVALALADKGVRVSTVRLAPTVHGDGDHGFMSTIISVAREKGVSAYVGDGSNRWPAVHRLDAAHLFRLAVENAPAGSVLHGIADEGVSLRAVAEVIGRHLDVPVTALAPEDSAGHFGWLGHLLAADIPSSSTLTRELLAWQPMQPGLVEDLEKGHYFRSPAA